MKYILKLNELFYSDTSNIDVFDYEDISSSKSIKTYRVKLSSDNYYVITLDYDMNFTAVEVSFMSEKSHYRDNDIGIKNLMKLFYTIKDLMISNLNDNCIWIMMDGMMTDRDKAKNREISRRSEIYYSFIKKTYGDVVRNGNQILFKSNLIFGDFGTKYSNNLNFIFDFIKDCYLGKYPDTTTIYNDLDFKENIDYKIFMDYVNLELTIFDNYMKTVRVTIIKEDIEYFLLFNKKEESLVLWDSEESVLVESNNLTEFKNDMFKILNRK